MKRLLTFVALLAVFLASSQNEEIDRLTVQLTYQKEDSLKVDTSLLLISKLIDSKDFDKAILYANQTISLSKKLNYTSGLAAANYYKGLIYNSKDDYFNAIDNLGKAKQLYLQSRDTLGLAKVSNRIGIIEIERGNYEIGLKNALSAISIFENFNLNTELSEAYNSLGEAYLNTHYIDKSLEYNKKALQVRKYLKDSTGIKSSTTKIAFLYSLRKEYRKAIEYYEEVLKILNNSSDKKLRGEILPRLGNEYLKFNEYDKATSYLLEGLQYNRKENNEEGLAIVLNGLGNLNIERNKLKLAESQLLEAFQFAKKNNLTTELLENYRLRITLDSTRGYFQNAFKWQSEYYALKEQTKKTPVVLQNELESFDGDFTTEESGKNIIKNKTTEKTSLDLKSNLLVYVLIAICVLLLTVLIVTLLNYNKLKQEFSNHDTVVENLENKFKDLESHAKELEETNQVKDKLFSIVSHDLKDSISSIKAFLDLLKEDSISREEFHELIPELSENADNASALLFNLLNWSKSQLQNLEPKPELFNIQEVFRNKMDLVEQKVENKSIVLIDESERDFVYADKSMIEIVIQNLITNAIKFSRQGDMITISNIDKNGKALICVEDTGVGISKENISKLFNAANNFTTVGTKNEKGTGLGLSIAKDLIELNKGKIWVDSTLNVGSKFFIELPKTAPKVS